MADKRDEQTWVSLELSRIGEQKASEGTLESSLRRDLGVDPSWPVFIPSTTYSRNNKKVTIHLLEGYAFVGTGLTEVEYFALERKQHVTQVMSIKSPKGLRTLSVLADKHIQDMRLKMRTLVTEDIELKTRVDIVDGLYTGLSGNIIHIEGDHVLVFIGLYSISIIASIPRVFVEISPL